MLAPGGGWGMLCVMATEMTASLVRVHGEARSALASVKLDT